MALCFIFLLMLLQTQLSLHSKLEDAELGKRSALKLNDKPFMEDNSGKRLQLHEVHSGPNPITNSFKEKIPETSFQTAP
ncbi:hypothetical protein QVD17_19369 [Tagetes erecta]|uniref:Uncharacterized protein n=1 Tax=Tagetes erecta TaxID=13708 RepID=A0AAD8KJF7_TARER|nr:hypothetical protein QVD17_19369 [Tagetes erecta]